MTEIISTENVTEILRSKKYSSTGNRIQTAFQTHKRDSLITLGCDAEARGECETFS